MDRSTGLCLLRICAVFSKLPDKYFCELRGVSKKLKMLMTKIVCLLVILTFLRTTALYKQIYKNGAIGGRVPIAKLCIMKLIPEY